MAEFAGEILAVGRQGEKESVGHFQPGSFTVSIPPLADVPAADKQARIFQLGTAQAIFAGSIEAVTWDIALLVA